MKKVISVVGARPNFMKVSPVHRELLKNNRFISKIVHTGQHYDEKMSQVFFEQLELPKPDYYLGAKGNTPTELTANIMVSFEEVLAQEKPDLVLVAGDVTSTLACTLAAVQRRIRVGHIESGLRSFDRDMPEEINRLLTDAVSDYLFVSEPAGVTNLQNEGVPADKVFYVGNCMIDSVVYYKDKIAAVDIQSLFQVKTGEYIIVTMHRPSNVDDPVGLKKILEILTALSAYRKIVLPLHPRTANNLQKYGMLDTLKSVSNILLTEPLGYLEFMALLKDCSCVLTDSGGIQEETTFLGIPCVTFRENTERPVTCDIGTNFLMKELDVEKTISHVKELINKEGEQKKHTIPDLWDGKAAERIAAIIEKILS